MLVIADFGSNFSRARNPIHTVTLRRIFLDTISDGLALCGQLGCLTGVAAGLGIAVLSRLPQFRTSANSILFNSVGYSLSVVLFSAVLVVSLGLNARTLIFRFLNSRGLRYIGQISYSMYLVHMAMIILASRITTNLIVQTGVALALTILYSALSWRFMESRFLGPNYFTNKTRELADGCSGTLPVRAS